MNMGGAESERVSSKSVAGGATRCASTPQARVRASRKAHSSGDDDTKGCGQEASVDIRTSSHFASVSVLLGGQECRVVVGLFVVIVRGGSVKKLG